MGIVYRAHDPILDREVALKTVDLPDSLSDGERRSFLDRFLLEARVAGKLVHPNIVVTYDAEVDESKGIPFIAMELVDGETLAEILDREGALEWRRAIRVGVSLAGALAQAHQEGIVHRDIKPANVLLTPKGVPKLADFGIAKVTSAEITQEGMIIGTPQYMSPEQVQGHDIDGRSDLFSLGSLIYKLVSGQSPFQGPDIANISQQVLFKRALPLMERCESVPSDLDQVLAKAMAKDRADRFGSAEEMAESLVALLAEQSDPGIALDTGRVPDSGLDDLPTEVALERPLAESSSENQPKRAGFAGPTFGASSEEIDMESAADARDDSLGGDDERVVDAEHGAGSFRIAIVTVAVIAAVYGLSQVPGARSFLEASSQRLVASVERRSTDYRNRELLKEEGRLLMEQASEARDLGAWETARSLLDESLVRFQHAADGVSEARCLLERGRLFSDMGAWTEARADLGGAQSVARIYESKPIEVMAALEVARLDADQNRLDQAEARWSEAARLSIEHMDAGFEETLASSLPRLGISDAGGSLQPADLEAELAYTRAYLDLMSASSRLEPSIAESLTSAAAGAGPGRQLEANALLALLELEGRATAKSSALLSPRLPLSDEPGNDRLTAFAAAQHVQRATMLLTSEAISNDGMARAREWLDLAEASFRQLGHRPGMLSVLRARRHLFAPKVPETDPDGVEGELQELRESLGLAEIEASEAAALVVSGWSTARTDLRQRRLSQVLMLAKPATSQAP